MNIMTPRLLRSLLCIALCLLVARPFAAQAASCCKQISLEVTSENTPGNMPVLHVRVRNNDNSALRIGPAQNPWVGPAMLKLVGMRLPEGVPIHNKTQAVIDPSPFSESVQPRGSVEDVIDLVAMYPELAAEIRKGRHDIIVFWTYKFMSEDTESERFGGWVLFEAQKK